MSAAELSLTAEQRQKLQLSQRQLQGLGLLMRSLPELRAEIIAQIEANPVLEDIDHPLETPLSELERERSRDGDASDYPDDGYEPERGLDEEAAERRQKFFDSMPDAAAETLQVHLLAQLPTSDIAPEDRLLAELIIADLDDDGRFVGSVPDMRMATGASAETVAAVRRSVLALDPPGCGACDLRECLLAQLDRLPVSPEKAALRKLLSGPVEDLAPERAEAVRAAHGLSEADYRAARALLLSLDPHPGRPFPNERDRVEYVNPEIHAVRREGWWYPVTDKRSLPDIRIAQKYREMLDDPATDGETRRYLAEHVDAANALKAMVAERQSTLQAIADIVFVRQQDFFDEGYKALVPLTEGEVAETLGLSPGTVSRAVCNKYVTTPFGTVELRRFFTTGVRTAAGVVVSQDAVLAALRRLVETEDKASPHSDGRLSELLSAEGFKTARRTVAKYRDILGIPAAKSRGNAK